MDPEISIREGRPSEALAALEARVRKDPAHAPSRVFLFQVLAVLGEWTRAIKQLDVASKLDAGTLAMAQTYRAAVRAEVLREQVFRAERTPIVFGDPAPWIAHVVEALRCTVHGEDAAAAELRASAFEQAQARAGTLAVEGREPVAFEWIADADTRLGPVLESVVEGRYCWVPFERIRRVVVEAPHDLRDLVWTPAWFTWTNGGESPGLIPTRYPDSARADDALRMARRTEWEERPAGAYLGTGQRVLATDACDVALLEVRRIEFADGDGVDG